MSSLDRQINHARRRLTQNVLFQRLSFGILLVAGLWALTIVVARLFALNVPLWHGAWVAALIAAFIAAIGTSLARPSALRAAVVLDSAAGLKERLSTALVLHQSADPFARAAVRDAERSAGRIHVPSHIRYRPPTLWPWSAALVLVALILVQFMPTVDLLAGEPEPELAVPAAEVAAERQAIERAFDERLNKLKELAEENPDLKNLMEDLQPLDMPDTPGVTPEDIRREAVKRIDDVRDKLKEQLDAANREQMMGLKRMLNKLEPQPGNDPGSKLSQALASGDFKAAQEALQDLVKQIEEAAKNADDPETRKKLAEMQRKLSQMANQIAKLSDTVQLQKELENKAGLSEEQAKKLLEELSKMDPKQLEKELQKRLGEKGLTQEQIKQIAKKIQQNQQARKTCQNLAQSLAQAAQGCQQCNQPGGAGAGSSQAGGALGDAMGQLSQLEMSEQLMNELQAQLSDLDNLRGDVCEGGMCNRFGRGRPGPIGMQGPQYGRGIGARIGQEKVAYGRDPTKAKTRFNSGAVIGTMLVDGPQVGGEASREDLEAAHAEVRDAQDAIERQEVPRQYDKVLREYFERLAGLVDRQREIQEEEPPAEGE